MSEPIPPPQPPEQCRKSAATAAAFVDSKVWRRCVRKKDHEGECFYGLSERDELAHQSCLAEQEAVSRRIKELENDLACLKGREYGHLEQKREIAEMTGK